MRSCEVTLISSLAEMPWTQAATAPVDVCWIKDCIEMTKSKALPAIDISFCFRKAPRVYYATPQILLPAFITAHVEGKKKDTYIHI